MKLEKILKILDEEVASEFEGKDTAWLNSTIAVAEASIDKAKRERDALPAYQTAKEAVKALSAGLKDVKAYQTAKIALSLLKLREQAGETVGDNE